MIPANKTVDYVVTAVSGRALASFETAGAAQSFRDDRRKRRVPTRLFKVETTREELA